jgi:hypothetical protein
MNLTQDFLEDYRRLSADVAASRFRTFSDNLYRWFDSLDNEPVCGPLSQNLENEAEFEKWYEDQKATMGGMVGSARISWPDGKEKRLGMQLSLFRAFLMEGVDVNDFSSYFLGANDHDLSVNEITTQYFRPFSDDLIRFFVRISPEDAAALSSTAAPASDRVVALDHNSNSYHEAVNSIEELKRAVTTVNDFPDEDARSERISELNAGLELLKAARIRTAAFGAVLASGLGWLLKKFAGEAIGKLADAAIEKIGALLGEDWLDWF